MKKKLKVEKPFLVGLAYKIHPSLGKLYEASPRFFNDGIVELLCLIILNVFLFFLTTFGIVGLSLVIVNLCIVTPITFCLKYFLHKTWVWKQNDEGKHRGPSTK